jgi:hypothetical protein
MCLLALFIGSVSAREVDKADRRVMQSWSNDEFGDPGMLDAGVRDLYTAAQVDTFCLVWYDFEQMNWQGWTQKDNTSQEDIFSHVDDFSGLGTGSWGGLVALEGLQSMWCGARDWAHQIVGCPGNFVYMCSWTAAPGYGNDWNQMLESDPIPFQGLLTFSYHGYFDSEPDYDWTTVEYDAGGGNWIEIGYYDGAVDTIAIHELLLSQAKTKLRFHFTSDGAWSDQDGLWDTDGAFIVDSIIVADIGGTIDYENFEAPAGVLCARNCGIWNGGFENPFGLYSGLVNNLADKDPCGDNFATQVVFFVGSPYPSSDYPGLFDVPFCKGPGNIEAPCHNESIISPIIDMAMYSSTPNNVQDTPIPPALLPTLGGAYLRFTVYRDLPIPNLSFYIWSLRNIDPVDGCPGPWQDDNYVYYGPDQDYIFSTEPVGDIIGVDTNGDGITDPCQMRIGIQDQCAVWYEVYGNCANHTPSPWFDNVRLYRFVNIGPQWSWRDLDIFQDNFPEVEFDLESYIRADAANDLRPNDDPVIDPGDSAVVTVTSPLAGGIDTTADGWPKVYCHVYPEYIGDPLSPKPTLWGPTLAGTYGRYDSDDGSTWTIFQCEYARTGAGNIAADLYAVDLNDSLFTRGYRVNFYFKAYDFMGQSTTLPSNADEGGYFEWTCLPTLASDILFVDDFHGRGTIRGTVEQYWNPSFRAVLPPENQPDRYDVNNPSSAVSNGPGSRAKNYHMTTAYKKVIWDSGNLEETTISEGGTYSDKSNDAQMLVDWMEFSPHRVGLWVLGDDVAADLAAAPSGVALTLLTAYCGVQFTGDSYYALSGIVTPKVMAVSDVNNPLWHTTWGDSCYAFGGCPIINQFDYLEKTGNGQYALQYPDVAGLPYYAGIYSNGINDGGYDIRTMWFGFSFMYIRDVAAAIPVVRNQIVADVVLWMQNDINSNITKVDEVPAVNSLSQNFPNPFNPTTTIKFGLRSKGNVSIKIYDVAGRLVKTLVNEVREAGHYDVTWNGDNNHGNKVASGVYFFKMKAVDFEKTNKMVLMR